tara:strand:- start:161 stop:2539 length:2379 start_codon:yes stop_codon:yes gene_type:complete
MARANEILTNFLTGEMSPLLHGRVDTERYGNAVKTCENFTVKLHGGLERRAGTHFVAETKDSSKKSRLIRFEFNRDQSYILEFGDEYIRFFTQNGKVVTYAVASPTITAGGSGYTSAPTVTFSAPPQGTTATGTAVLATDGVASVSITAGGSGYTAPETTPVTFSAPPSGLTATGSVTISAGAITAITVENSGSGYTTAPTITIGGTGSGATATATLGANGVGSITITNAGTGYETPPTISFSGGAGSGAAATATLATTGTTLEMGSPYTEAQLGEIQVAQSADVIYIVHPEVSPRKLSRISNTLWTLEEPFFFSNDSTTLSAAITSTTSMAAIQMTSTEKFAESGGVFKVDDEQIRYTGKSATELTGITRAQNGTTGATHTNGALVQIPKWDQSKKYPRAITFHQERLWMGGTTEKPQSIFASKTDIFEDFTIGANDADGLEYAIASYRINRVQWMSSTEVLIVGTAGGEFKVSGGGAALTPSNVQVTRQTAYGGKNIQPRHVGYQTLFVDSTGTKIRSYEYQFNQDIYESEDLTFLAEHITAGGITEMAYQAVPDEIIWAIRGDGILLGMTYNKGRSIVGWHRHVTDGTFESVSVIPQATRDQVWVVVKRTIGGVTKRFVEYLDPDINVDSGLTYSGSAITNITGLGHLEGKTVSILGDDAVYPDAVVSSGAITLSSSVTKLSVGLKYTSTMTTLPVEGANPAGTAQGRRKRWNEIYVRLNNSFIPTVNGVQPPVRSPSTHMGLPESKMTGDVRVQNVGYDLEGKITVAQSLPGPTHLLAIFGTVSVNQG